MRAPKPVYVEVETEYIFFLASSSLQTTFTEVKLVKLEKQNEAIDNN